MLNIIYIIIIIITIIDAESVEKIELLIRAFLQNAAPGLVTKELTHARSCTRHSTHSIANLAMLDRLVIYSKC